MDSADRSDLSITLFCDSDETCTPVNSDQVLSDGRPSLAKSERAEKWS